MAAGIPLVIAILAIGLVESRSVKALIWIAGMVMTCGIHMLWIPLERR
jgi:hypothetical protein